MSGHGTAASGRHIMWHGKWPDGSELLITRWPDGVMTAATKPPPQGFGVRVWSPPITLEETD